MSGPQENNGQGLGAEARAIVDAIEGRFTRLENIMEGFNNRIERVEARDENQNRNERQNERMREEVVVGDGEDDDEEERNHRSNRRGNRGDMRDQGDENDNIGSIKVSIPPFAGKRDPDAYLDWERKVERIFECHNYSERKKLKMVILEFSDYSSLWWHVEVIDRRNSGDRPVGSWREMKVLMRNMWVSASYRRELLQQLQELVQGKMTVAEYDHEEQKLMTKLGTNEEPQTTITRFIKGLNWEIQDEVDTDEYLEYEEVVKKAIQVEKKLKKKKQMLQNWSPNRDGRRDFKPRRESTSNVSKAKAKIDVFATRISATKCFRCQGRGHIAKTCLNKQRVLLLETGE